MSTEEETLLEATLAKEHLKDKAKEKFGKLEKLGGGIVTTETVKNVTQKVRRNRQICQPIDFENHFFQIQNVKEKVETKIYGPKESEVSQKEIKDADQSGSAPVQPGIQIKAVEYLIKFAKLCGIGFIVYFLGFFR